MKFIRNWRFIFYPVAMSIEKMMRREADSYLENCPKFSPGYDDGCRIHAAANLIPRWLRGYKGPRR